MWLTGGAPGETISRGKTLDFVNKLNPFSLTPDARAHEYLTMMTDYYGSYIVAPGKSAEEIMTTINSASKGALGPKFGHAFLTEEGRSAQGFASLADVAAKNTYADYLRVQDDWVKVQSIAEALGAVSYTHLTLPTTPYV